MKRLVVLGVLALGLAIFTCSDEKSKADANYPNLGEGLYAELETTKGRILVQLEFEKTPLTVMNFIGLAEGTISFKNRSARLFYDGLTFHRVIKDFMIQGGCPLGNGMGNPGYFFPDEIHPDLRHDRAGIVSMANAGPDTNGSQFFITHKPTPWLDARHTVFGRIVRGQEVVNSIEQGDKIIHISIIRVGEKAKRFVATNEAFANLKAQNAKRLRQLMEDEIKKRWPDLLKTSSGLYYQILKEGSGSKPGLNALVTVHYEGMLIWGNVFDSTYIKNKPSQFRLDGVIAGFREGILAMRRGEKRLLVIPPELGYGRAGAGDVIPPNSWLVFKVELLDF